MSEELARNNLDVMPLSLHFDKTPNELKIGTSVSRESSFSSVELGTSVSRNSSFSSLASSSGSSIFDRDSSCPASRSSSWRSNDDGSDIQRILSITDQQYRRLHNARAKFRKGGGKGRNSASSGHDSESFSAEMYHTPPESAAILPISLGRPEIHGRSCSVPEALLPNANHSKLSCPDGLVISTPPMKSFMEYRLRSRSFTGAEQSSEGIHQNQIANDLKNSALGPKNKEEAQSFEKSDSKEDREMKEVEKLRQERDELSHDCDRLQCELNAITVERDALLRDKEELQRELNNRNDVIQHLQDHINSSMKSLMVPEEFKPSVRQRSKSEVHRPAFFLPGEIAKTNAYTCL